MIILGIDPGIARTGWGVVKKTGIKLEAIAYGCIQSAANSQVEKRIIHLFSELNKIVSRNKPSVAGIETLIFNTNVKTAMRVGEARGVLLLALAKSGVEIREFTPLQVKQAVAGYGRAEKAQVQKMVMALLHLNKVPRPDDAADALAVAITAATSRKL